MVAAHGKRPRRTAEQVGLPPLTHLSVERARKQAASLAEWILELEENPNAAWRANPHSHRLNAKDSIEVISEPLVSIPESPHDEKIETPASVKSTVSTDTVVSTQPLYITTSPLTVDNIKSPGSSMATTTPGTTTSIEAFSPSVLDTKEAGDSWLRLFKSCPPSKPPIKHDLEKMTPEP